MGAVVEDVFIGAPRMPKAHFLDHYGERGGLPPIPNIFGRGCSTSGCGWSRTNMEGSIHTGRGEPACVCDYIGVLRRRPLWPCLWPHKHRPSGFTQTPRKTPGFGFAGFTRPSRRRRSVILLAHTLRAALTLLCLHACTRGSRC